MKKPVTAGKKRDLARMRYGRPHPQTMVRIGNAGQIPLFGRRDRFFKEYLSIREEAVDKQGDYASV
ncbi:hypothetical protein [Cohnella faecalis]|uniref:hypothetical protein n=1 Tax=Cohnella faecalis TaxID=2315694 RepID=UPI0011C23233|nr:hypothetical protein [Cohnella faecalis]